MLDPVRIKFTANGLLRKFDDDYTSGGAQNKLFDIHLSNIYIDTDIATLWLMSVAFFF